MKYDAAAATCRRQAVPTRGRSPSIVVHSTASRQMSKSSRLCQLAASVPLRNKNLFSLFLCGLCVWKPLSTTMDGNYRFGFMKYSRNGHTLLECKCVDDHLRADSDCLPQVRVASSVVGFSTFAPPHPFLYMRQEKRGQTKTRCRQA